MKSPRLIHLVILALVTFGVFANTLDGDFVYDDKRQILMNPLIQDPGLYGKALVSDVWAFKADGNTVTSNYWRPTYTAWSIINFRFFGARAFGWHVLNILLHLSVCLLAYLLLGQLGLTEVTSFVIALIYAVHPVHSESVAWIAGSPDLLFGAFLLLSLLCAERAAREQGRTRTFFMAASVAAYLLSLGAKESAFLCFPIFYLIANNAFSDVPKAKSSHERNQNALRFMAPFALASIGYFLIRWWLLGQISRPAENGNSTVSALLSVPEVFVFYLRQMLFPLWLSPNYWLRAVGSIDLANFWLPSLLSAVAIIALWKLARMSRVGTIGAALFILPILPAFNIGAFLPEQIVHDRYLYVPLLGFLMLVVPAVERAATTARFAVDDRSVFVTAGVVISAVLSLQTLIYNNVWKHELSLWQHAVVVDPNSSANWSALGAAYSDENLLDQSLQAYDRSLAIWSRPQTLIGRSQVLIKKGEVDTPIKNMLAVVSSPPDNIDLYALYQAYEALSIALEDKGEYAEAERYLRQARTRLPMYNAALTEKLAVILYNENQKQDAVNELESAKSSAMKETLPASKAVFYRLGMLYAELGNRQAALQDLNTFLRLSTTAKDLETDAERQDAIGMLRKLQS